ncbi:hypothetical protein F4861DRAFT_539507 [Xylaria intraflava]|nr:hypothetical protein F4861DRAFT_539507 [Xylaria intraflava]
MFGTAAQRPIGLASDIWTLGCSIFAIFGQLDLFEGFFPDEDDAFAEKISAPGKSPRTWWDSWGARRDFFNAEGDWEVKVSRHMDVEYRSLEARVQRIKRDRNDLLGDDEIADFAFTLRDMLRWEPEERISAQDLATGTWMTKWGSKRG